VATALSIIAISLSALTFLWTIGWSLYTHRRSTRPSVLVSGSFALPLSEGGEAGATAVDVTVTNTGQVAVTISSVAFEIEGRDETLAILEWPVQSPRPLPTPLATGDHWTGLVEAGRLVGSLVQQYGPTRRRIRPVASDPAGNRYRSERWLDL
jgi:hypothetical protein